MKSKIAACTALGVMLSLAAPLAGTASAAPAPKMVKPHAKPAGTSWAGER